MDAGMDTLVPTPPHTRKIYLLIYFNLYYHIKIKVYQFLRIRQC